MTSRLLSSIVAATVLAYAGLASRPASAASAPTDPGFADSFAAAVDAAPGYGLNDSLKARQTGAEGVTYTRTSGLWYPASAPQSWYTQVGHATQPDALSFWLGTSAVRMDAPLIAGADGTVGVRADVDPITGDTASGAWSSLVISNDPKAAGYVSGTDVALGVLVRSNGGLQVYQGKTAVLTRTGFAKPDANGRFTVAASYTPGARTAHVTVNGAAADVPVPAALPARSTLYMGSWLDDDTQTSTLRSLEASAVDRTGLVLSPSSNLRYYGYFAARLTGDSHVKEVSGRSNLAYLNISDYDRYRPELLDDCAPGTCVVNTGFEFFRCDTAGVNCHLYADYKARWAKLAAAVKTRIGRIGAFYLQDEPQYRGATSDEVATAAAEIKETFPGARVMMVEAGPAVTSSLKVPSNIDWVGFDWYCRAFSDVQSRLGILENLVKAHPEQKLFLVPEGAPLAECGSAAGHRTDADIAALQWQYFQLAEQHPRVVGLLNFGFWTAPAWTKGHGAADLPATVNADERIAARILTAPMQ